MHKVAALFVASLAGAAALAVFGVTGLVSAFSYALAFGVPVEAALGVAGFGALASGPVASVGCYRLLTRRSNGPRGPPPVPSRASAGTNETSAAGDR